MKTEKLQEFIAECLFIYLFIYLCQGHLGEQIAEGAPWLNKAHYYYYCCRLLIAKLMQNISCQQATYQFGYEYVIKKRKHKSQSYHLRAVSYLVRLMW